MTGIEKFGGIVAELRLNPHSGSAFIARKRPYVMAGAHHNGRDLRTVSAPRHRLNL